MFGLNRVAKAQIDNATRQILELEAVKKRLELDKDSIQIELANVKKRQQMVLEEEVHKQKLVLESEKAVFDRERKIWDKEKLELGTVYHPQHHSGVIRNISS